MFKIKRDNRKGDATELAAADSSGAKSKFFRMKETALGKYVMRKRDDFRNTKFYEECADIKESLVREDSTVIIMVKRFTPLINAWYSWRYSRQIGKMYGSLEKSAAFLAESLKHFKNYDAEQRAASMDDALRQARKSLNAIKATMAIAIGQTLWLAYDMVKAFFQSSSAVGLFQKVSEAFKDTATGTTEAISTAVSFVIMIGIHYAFHRKEKARKRELLAQDLAFLADSELNDLALILIRQKNRAEGRKDYDKEKAGSLLKKYEEVQDESVARRPLQSLYVTLEKAKKTRIHGNEAEFDGLMRLFIGELMWRGEFGRIEAVSHASGMNGPAVAAIAAEQVKAALGAGKPETASQINSKYGCYAPAEFEALNAGTP